MARYFVTRMDKQKKKKPNLLLLKARKERDWTQKYIAEKVGASELTVSYWETGKRVPGSHYRHALCELFQMSRADLGIEPHDNIEEEEDETAQSETLHTAMLASSDQQVDESIQNKQVLMQNLFVVTDTRFEFILQNRDHRDKDRLHFLQTIYSRWIAGVFHRLSNGPLLRLRLNEEPDAVHNPQRELLRDSYVAMHPTQAEDFHIIDVYDNAHGELLLLGAPGSGKSALLLELLSELLERAAEDEKYPLPVFLQLASWPQKRLPLADWLIEELHIKYHVSRTVAEMWVNQKRIIPLLDGLDEMSIEHRTACIEIINAYKNNHAPSPIVICSRKTDYFNQPARLVLHSAISTQPLTSKQLHAYATHMGKNLEAMHYVFKNDIRLRGMATNPFMLNMLALSYHGMSLEQVRSMESPEKLRTFIFHKYEERLLQKEDLIKYHYTPEQAKRWLEWLAEQQHKEGQTEFYLERLQPDWLPEQTRQRYRQTIIRLIFSIQIIINAALFSLLRGGRNGDINGVSIGLLGWLGASPGNSVLGWMAPGLGGGLEGGGSLGVFIAIVTLLTLLVIDGPIPQPSWRLFGKGIKQGIRNGFIVNICISSLSSILFTLKYDIGQGILYGLGAGLFSGLLVGLMTGLIAALRQHTPPKQSTSHHLKHLFSRETITDTSIFAFCATISFGLIYTILIRAVTINVIIYACIVGAFYGITFGVLNGTTLIRNLGTTIEPAEIVSWSWHNVIHQFTSTIKKGLFIGAAVMISVTFTIGLASACFHDLGYGLRYGLIYGLIIGIVGGTACILAGILHSGWSSGTIEEQQLVHVNEGIRRSAHNAGTSALLFGMIGGLTSGLACGIAFGIIGQIEGWYILAIGFALIFGSIFALQGGILNGGIACIEHYTLRFYLWQIGSMPWNYQHFLDMAAKQKILWKLGGGYMFTHKLLLEYFASSYYLPSTEAYQKKADTLLPPNTQNTKIT